MYEICTTIPIFYVATYMSRVMYDKSQIHLQKYCLPLTHAHAVYYVQVLKEGFPLATDIAA